MEYYKIKKNPTRCSIRWPGCILFVFFAASRRLDVIVWFRRFCVPSPAVPELGVRRIQKEPPDEVYDFPFPVPVVDQHHRELIGGEAARGVHRLGMGSVYRALDFLVAHTGDSRNRRTRRSIRWRGRSSLIFSILIATDELRRCVIGFHTQAIYHKWGGCRDSKLY